MMSIYDLGFVNLAIPAWQMAVYIALVSLFMIGRKANYSVLMTYMFGLYWGYYLFGQDLLTAAKGNPAVETAYITFGLALAALSLMALFYEER
ncbi:MAG: hypothetical protein HYT78_18655 [Deltaproteobacteria bacterium]|nr:hypothetical protein [Deltaproteobacteria bacterium]